MNDQIVCPHCRKSIPLSQAVSHQLKEQMDREREEEKKKWAAAFQKRVAEEKQKFEEEYAKARESIEQSLKQKLQKQMELEFKDTLNEKEELAKQKKELQDQLIESSRQMRKVRDESEQIRIEMEKKLAEEQEKMRVDMQKRAEEEYHLKMLEKDKKLSDVLKINEELKRKLEQGSQQTQGEVLELELESLLKREFPYDDIKPVAKGIRGADLLQIVKDRQGKACGTIIWETKRTKSWSNEWLSKLKEDQRLVKAELAVLVTQVLPPELKYFGSVDNIWICEYGCYMGVATALRSKLIEIAAVKMSSVGKNEKMEVLYNYLSGTEFKQRVEAIVEAFRAMQEDLKKERAWFMAKWAREEKNITKVIDNTYGMHGDLQSIIGKSLVEIEGMDLLPEKNEETPEQLF